MDSILNDKKIKNLFCTIASIKNEIEARNFFRDLCTIGEIVDMADRLEIAKMLDKNISYREISKVTGASTRTITRVAHWLHHGMGGYQHVLN